MDCPSGQGGTCDCKCEGCDPPPGKLHNCCGSHSKGCHNRES